MKNTTTLPQTKTIDEAISLMHEIAGQQNIKFIAVTYDEFTRFKNWENLPKEKKDKIVQFAIGYLDDETGNAIREAEFRFRETLGEEIDE